MDTRNVDTQGASRRGKVESANASRGNHTIKLADGEYRRLPDFEVDQNAEGSVLKDRSATPENPKGEKKCLDKGSTVVHAFDDILGALEDTKKLADVLSSGSDTLRKGVLVLKLIKFAADYIPSICGGDAEKYAEKQEKETASSIIGHFGSLKDAEGSKIWDEKQFLALNKLALAVLNSQGEQGKELTFPLRGGGIKILSEEEAVQILMKGLVYLDELQNLGELQNNDNVKNSLGCVIDDMDSAIKILGNRMGKDRWNNVVKTIGAACSIASKVGGCITKPGALSVGKALLGVRSFIKFMQKEWPPQKILSGGNTDFSELFEGCSFSDAKAEKVHQSQDWAVDILKNPNQKMAKRFTVSDGTECKGSDVEARLNSALGDIDQSIMELKVQYKTQQNYTEYRRNDRVATIRTQIEVLMKVRQDIGTALGILSKNLRRESIDTAFQVAGVGLGVAGVVAATTAFPPVAATSYAVLSWKVLTLASSVFTAAADAAKLVF